MAEQDLPTFTVKEAGDLLRDSLTPQQRDTSHITASMQKLDAERAAMHAALKKHRLESSKTLTEYGQDVATALGQGGIQLVNTAAQLASYATAPSELDRIAEKKLNLPQSKSLDEIFGINKKAKEAVDNVGEKFQSDRGKYRNAKVKAIATEREAGKEAGIFKLREEGYSENIATAIYEAGTAAETLMALKDNPSVLLDETIKSIPSMAIGGIGAKAGQKIAAGLKPGVVTEGTAGAATAIGLTEGANIQADARDQIRDMKHEDLEKNSGMYRQLLKEGFEPEEAKTLVADNASERAFLIGSTVGGLASKATGAAKFEGDLLANTTKEVSKSAIKKTVGNTLSEGAEEAIQSASGELTKNFAVQSTGDETQDITEGVGHSVAIGTAAGAGTGAVVGGTKNTVDAVKRGSKPIKTSVEDVEKIKKAKEEGVEEVLKEPVEERNINTVLDAIQQRNTKEGVTEKEHKENVDAALTAIKDNMQYMEELEQSIEGMDEETSKPVRKKLEKLQKQQTNAFEQYKRIQAREQASVTPESVKEAIDEGDSERLLQSFRTRPESVNEEDIELFRAASSDISPEVEQELQAHLAVEEAIKDMDAVSSDVLSGGPGFLGIRNYQVDINTALESNNPDTAQASLQGLRTFAERHSEKSAVLSAAVSGDANAKQQALDLYGIKKPSALAERVAKESIALNAAVAQAELRVNGVTTPTPTAESTKAEPEVDEASEFNLEEKALGTLEKRETLADKGFRVRQDTDKKTKAALSVEPDLMNKLAEDPTIATKYLDKDELTPRQEEAIKVTTRFHKQLDKSFNKLFKYNPRGAKKNYVQYLADENGQIDPNVRAALTVGVIDWVNTSAGMSTYNTKKDINSILGRDKDAYIPPTLMDMLTTAGSTKESIIDSIGSAAMRALNLETASDAAGNAKSSLEQALGGYGLSMLQDMGLITETEHASQKIQELLPAHEQTTDFDSKAKAKFYRAATIEVDGRDQLEGTLKGVTETFKDTDGLMGKLFNAQDNTTGPTDTPNKSVAKKMRNTFMDVPKRVQKIIKEHQHRAHYISKDKTDAFMALDRDVQLRILGYETDIDGLHVVDRKSAKAKNAAIVRELDHLIDYAEKFRDKPMYFTHEMTAANRLLLVSNTFNPQGSKVHRHFAHQADWAHEVDRSDPDAMRQFFTAVGEALGVTVDKGTWADYKQEIMDIVDDPATMRAAKALRENGDPELYMDYIKEGAYSYDGLYNLGNYYEALDTGANISTDLFREVDGVTNGVIIGILNMNAGKDKANVLQKLARGGIFTDGIPKLFGAFRAKNKDSYEAISDVWRSFIDQAMPSDNGTLAAIQEIFGTIERGDSKGGLMQTSYGAGDASIKAGVSRAFIEKFYKQVTKAAKAGDTTTLNNLSKAMNSIVPGSIDLSKDPLEQVLKNEVKIMKIVEKQLGEPLVQAIDKTYGSFKRKGKIVNQAMDVAYQSYMLMRNAEIKRLTDEKGSTLSKEELGKIDDGLRRAMPIMDSYFSKESGNITEGLFVGKYRNVRSEDPAYEVRLDLAEAPSGGKYKTVSSVGKERVMQPPGASPTVLGVQSIDAATMLEHLATMASLNVYDAIIVGQKDIYKQAQNINKKHLGVQADYSIMGAAQEAMQRSLDLLETYDPKLVSKIKFKDKDESLAKLQLQLDTAVPKVNAAKEEILSEVTLNSQYHVDGGEKYYAAKDSANPTKKLIQDTIANGIDYRGSSQKEIDPDNFSVDEEIQVDTLEDFQGPLQESVVRMSPLQVFDKLGSVGPIRENPQHATYLKNLLTNVVEKVMDPVRLRMQNDAQHETIGATNGLDTYIINQTAKPTATSGMTVNGIRMSSQEVYLHELIHNITQAGLDQDTALTRRLERLYEAAKRVATVEDFMNNPNDPTEKAAAQERYDHIFKPKSGEKRTKFNPSTGLYDTTQRSDHMHEFMAFAMTHKKFRDKLESFSPNLGAEFKASTNLLEMLASLFEVIMDKWHKLTVAKGNADVTAKDQLDNMFRALVGVEQQHKVKLFNELDQVIDRANEATNAVLTSFKKQVSKVAKSDVFLKSKFAGARVTGRVTGLIADDRAEFLVDAMRRLHQQSAKDKEGLLEAIVTEVQGRTASNGKFHDLNRVANMTIDQQRNQIKTLVAELSDKMYEGHPDGLTHEQKVAITKVALKTDLAALADTRSLEELQQLVASDKALDQEIAKVKAQLKQFKLLKNFYNRAAGSLGSYMATGKVTESHTPMNAKLIARLAGTGKARPNRAWITRAEPILDQLASLYALKNTPMHHRQEFSQVMLTEANNNPVKNGVSFTLHMASSLKKDAQKRLFKGHDGMVKGYTKETLNPHIAVEYGTIDDEAEMRRMGFTRVTSKPLPKDGRNPNQADIHMYVNKHGGMNRFAAGTMSYTGKVAKGTNTFTTRIQSGDVSPGVTGKRDIRQMQAAKQPDIDDMFNNPTMRQPGDELLVPLMNNVGNIVGYRYTMSEQVKDDILEKDNEFNNVLGSTASSIVDKESSSSVNRRLVDAMKQQFDDEYDENPGAFTEIGPNSSSKDMREIYYMMPDETRRYIKQKWGGETMYVKRDQINLIFGYRKYSITDIWNSDPEDLNAVQRAFIDSMDRLFSVWGGSAYAGLRSLEGGWQEIVKDMKDIIVIKSGIVTAVNTLSNTLSLQMLGVPVKNIVKHQAEAFRGAVAYQKDTKELRELEAILSADQRPNRRSLDQQRVAVLKNKLANNPVRELVESGVYQTIVEDIETTEGNNFSYKSNFVEKVGDLTEPLVSKVPQSVRDVAKNVYMSHDSKMYKIFNQAAVLSDFTARYALYKHYTERDQNQLSKKDAIAKVVSIFIDYDLPTHKGIQYGNDMGLIWFSKYNFRLQRILYETMKENPAGVIGTLALQGAFGDLPSMYDNSVFTHDMTSMFRNPVSNLDVATEIAPINLGSSVF